MVRERYAFMSSYPLITTIPQGSAWFPPSPRAEKPGLRLFCFPYAGAGSVAYRPWAASLPEVEIRPVLLPGRETRLREQPLQDPQQLIAILAAEIQPFLDRPFAFFGHSLGALIAFALARRLRSLPAPLPVHLFLSGRRAPHCPDGRSPLSSLPDTAFIQGVQQRYNGIPQPILQEPELMALFLPMLRADFSLLENFRIEAEEPFDFPISVFGGTQDPGASSDDLAGWRIYTTSTFSQSMFPGDHFFIQSQRALLLQAIAQDLAPHLPRMTGN